MKNFLKISLLFIFISLSNHVLASGDSTQTKPRQDYQIFLKQPAKQIKLIMYEKNFLPIQGKLSEDRRSVIMKDYEGGNRVHVKVVYEDGTEDEFVRSPCYIDPVVL
jgi:hypothetical protein